MTPELTNEQLRAIQEHGERPVEAVDPSTNKVYILIAREQYERLKPLFEEDPLSTEEQRELIRKAGERAGWDDPEMDAYDNYDEQRSKKP